LSYVDGHAAAIIHILLMMQKDLLAVPVGPTMFADVSILGPISPSVLPASAFSMLSYCIESNLMLENFSHNLNFFPIWTRRLRKFLPEFLVTSL